MSSKQQPQFAWLEGAISVEAALRGQNRKVDGIFVRRGRKNKDLRRLARLAEGHNVALEEVPGSFIEEHASGRSHGGILARVGPRQFLSAEELLSGVSNALVVMLDGIEDPFNFGQAVRALYAAGAHGLIVRPRNWLSAAGTVARASAGCSELMPMTVAESPGEAAKIMRAEGLRVACTAKRSAVSLYDADLRGPLFMLIGGERRGVSRAFVAQADLLLHIPYGRKEFNKSIGAAPATAVFAFEAMRQRS